MASPQDAMPAVESGAGPSSAREAMSPQEASRNSSEVVVVVVVVVKVVILELL